MYFLAQTHQKSKSNLLLLVQTEVSGELTHRIQGFYYICISYFQTEMI